MREHLLIASIKYTYLEHKNNFKNMKTLAKENMYQLTLRTSLGLGWVVIRDFVYFSAFILFRYLMSGSGLINGMNFTLYLMLGLIPWNFMSECINSGVMAIKGNKSVLSSIKFPIAILSTIDVLSIFMKRMFTIFIMLFVVIVFGDINNVTIWMFVYYFACMFVFMFIWNLIFSGLVSISNDFEQLYRAITSILFFTMPIMWSFEIIRPYPWIIRVLKLNPFVYIVEGFRDACHSGTMPDLEYTLYFWIISIILFCIGSILQFKLKSHYVDLI